MGHVHLPRVGLKVGYCLTDMDGSHTGATLFAPGSNRLAEPLVIPKDQIHPAEYLEPRLKAGDAFLFESRIYHGAEINSQDHVSKVAMFGYHYSWIRPDYYLRYYADEVQPSAAVVANLDDVGRQLLGATADAQGAKTQRHPLVHCRMGRRARLVFGKGTAANRRGVRSGIRSRIFVNIHAIC